MDEQRLWTLQSARPRDIKWSTIGSYSNAVHCKAACRRAHKKLVQVFGAISTADNQYRILDPEGVVQFVGHATFGRQGLRMSWEIVAGGG